MRTVAHGNGTPQTGCPLHQGDRMLDGNLSKAMLLAGGTGVMSAGCDSAHTRERAGGPVEGTTSLRALPSCNMTDSP